MKYVVTTFIQADVVVEAMTEEEAILLGKERMGHLTYQHKPCPERVTQGEPYLYGHAFLNGTTVREVKG